MCEYLSFADKLEIKEYPSSLIVMYVKEDKEYNLYNIKELRKNFVLSKTAEEIIRQIDGTKTLDDIIKHFVQVYNEDYESISNKVTAFLKMFQDTHELKICKSDEKKYLPVDVVENAIHYPTIASLELTDRCNLQCIHCYGEYDIINHNTMSYENVEKILTELKEIGVEVIELTGGECTIHPDFKKIIVKALQLGFVQIAILTNGIALNEELIKLIANNRSRILVQVDLQSLNDDYLFWFTKKRNTLNPIKDNIALLAKYDIRARVATTVTHKNIHEIYDIAEWLYNTGIKLYALTLVTNIGRAKEESKDLYLDEEDIKSFNEQTMRINEKFDKLLNESPTSNTHANCGCLTNHVTINPSGDIKLCAMDNLQYSNSSIGNVLHNNIKKIYDDNRDFLNIFYEFVPPNRNMESCKECEKRFFCNECILRTLISISELKDECKWYKDGLPESIKQKFGINF